MKHTLVPLGSVCSINPKSARYDDDFEVSFIPMQSVGETGTIDTSMVKPYFEVKKGYTGFIEGDVLFAKITPCMENGKGAIAAGLCNGVGYGSTEFHVLRPSESITAKWLYYLTSWDVFRKECERNMTGSAGQKRVPAKYLESYRVHVPSHSEQVRITTILDRICEQIRLHEEMLAEFDRLVKSRFIEMFGDITNNDRGWETQPLGDLCTIVRGGSPRPIEKFLGGDVPWIKIGDATDGESVYLHSTKEHIIQEGVAKSRKVKAGSLIFANCGVSLGFARIITFDGCIHDGWLAMEDIDSRLDKVFLLQALNQMTEHFRKIAPAGTQPNLNTAIMKAYRQIIPPMEQQTSFIRFVEQTDKSKFSLKNGGKEADFAVKCIWESLCRGTPT